MGRRTRVLGTLASLSLAGGLAGYAAPAAAQTSASSAVSEVVVTAQRREENVQEVPITVTVVSSDQLGRQNIITTSDLTRAIPALTITDLGVYQVRSIGTSGFGRGVEQSVSTVLDGVVLGATLNNAMYDLERVEVLSGPQGTLFGKNASAGVINIVTKAPVLGQFQAIGHIDAATSRDYVHAYVVGNVPIGENAALRLSYHHDSTGNIVYNTVFQKWDHNTDDGVRARLLWQPNDRLTVNLYGDYQKLKSNGVNGGNIDFASVQVHSSAPAGSPLAATLAACGIVAGPKNNKSCANSLYDPLVDEGSTYDRWNGGWGVQVDWEFWRDLTLTSITAKRESLFGDLDVAGNIAGGFGDSLPSNILDRNLVPFRVQIFSQEFRVQSPASKPLNFVGGLYYAERDSHDSVDQSGQLGAALGALQFRRLINIYIETKTYAAFGQVNWRPSPKWQFQVGGRITRDTNEDLSFNSFPGPFLYTANTGFFSVFPINSCTLAGGNPDVAGSCPAGTSLTEPARLETTGVNWRLGAQYYANRNTMVFATLTKGYKGPSFNESASFPIRPDQLFVRSEHPLAFELGFKTTLFDRLAFDVTAFTNKIEDFQTTVFVPASPTQLVANFIQGNAPHVISRGVEVLFFGKVTPNFTLNGGAIYTDAHFNKGFLVNCATGPCPARRQLPYAPRFKATLSGEYHRPIGGQLEGFAQADLAYWGKYFYTSTPGFPGTGSRAIVGARAGVRSEGGKWGVAVFCRNCLDKNYPVYEVLDPFRALNGGVGPPPSQVQILSLNFYRLIGVTLDARF